MLRGSGPAAVPSLVQGLHNQLLTHVEGASSDLQKVHPHYAKVAVSLHVRRCQRREGGTDAGSAGGGGEEGREEEEVQNAEREAEMFKSVLGMF